MESAITVASTCTGASTCTVTSMRCLAELREAIDSGEPSSVFQASLDVMTASVEKDVGEHAPETTSLADFQQMPATEVREDRFHDVALWSDALAQLGRTCDVFSDTFMDGDEVIQAGQSVLAAANFALLLSSEQRERAIDELVSILKSEPLLTRRKRAISAAQSVPGGSDGLTERCGDDSQLIDALYECVLSDLGPALSRHGFPTTRCGLRTMAAVSRSTCGQGLRVASALGGLWHASPHPGPIVIAPRGAHDGEGPCTTLVVAFSSLGWDKLVRPEWGHTLRGLRGVAVAHAIDASKSWFSTNPTTGEFDAGGWWDAALAELCRPYREVCLIGDSMGASAALRFAAHATSAVVALVPQVDLSDFPQCRRADLTLERRAQLRDATVDACDATPAAVWVHTGTQRYDVAQPRLLRPRDGLHCIVHDDVPSHILAAGLKAKGVLKQTVLRNLGLCTAHDEPCNP